jgi:hypothetical protein
MLTVNWLEQQVWKKKLFKNKYTKYFISFVLVSLDFICQKIQLYQL